MSVTDLYIALISDKPIEKVYPPERQEYIQSASNQKLCSQRYFVWKLLEYALKNSFGFCFKEMKFNLNEHGRWECDKCFFSLSHSKNVVAAAVSDGPVGVDIEFMERSFSDKLYKKILTEKEISEYINMEKSEQKNYLIKKWTAKESLFKIGESKVFHPKELQNDRKVYTNTIILNDIAFCYSVTNDNIEKLRVFTNIEL